MDTQKCPICRGVDMDWVDKHQWWEHKWCGTIIYKDGTTYFNPDDSELSTRELLGRVQNLYNDLKASINDPIGYLKTKMEETHERVKNNPEEARKMLRFAGIIGEDGELTEHYRTNKND